MRLDKKIILGAAIIILFGLLLFLPNIVALIPSERVQFALAIIFCFLVFLLLIYVTYNDIRKKQYTTAVFIVLADIIIIVAFAAICYTYFHKSNVTNTEILLRKIHIRTIAGVSSLCASILLSFLRSQRFIKKNKIGNKIE